MINGTKGVGNGFVVELVPLEPEVAKVYSAGLKDCQ